ncbi:MAG TPA: FAD/NAD(P)-binding oxidoreductase [Anaerolineales bacterium]|nr:FAD/NAD(P)-binding oxidoreductase [Anaerolineales bacterium]
MNHYKYLIIGGGLAGDAATRGIRELDPEGTIGMISSEPDPPYMRPNLSKGLWKGRPVEKIWRKTGERVTKMHLGCKITHLDPTNKLVRDESNDEYTYEKLLLATGGTPNHLPFGEGNIIYYRNFQDYQHLRKLTEQGKRFVVIGGGFIGSELAAALSIVGQKVVMIFPDHAISDSIFPADLAEFLNEYYRLNGVELVTGDSVASVQKDGDRLMVRTGSGRAMETDGVVAGVGIHPNLELAKQAGLQIDNGIVVNEQLQTINPDIYAAGDAANFFHSALGKRVRVEHEDNAVQMGKLAGRNMAGTDDTYTHIPMFYSDLFELGYEAVGETSSKMETFSDWEELFKKGVIYYLEQGRVRGVILWNVWEKVDEARALMKEKGPFTAGDLRGKIKG